MFNVDASDLVGLKWELGRCHDESNLVNNTCLPCRSERP